LEVFFTEEQQQFFLDLKYDLDYDLDYHLLDATNISKYFDWSISEILSFDWSSNASKHW